MAGLFVVGDLGGTNCRLELLDTSIPEPHWHGTRPTVAKAKYGTAGRLGPPNIPATAYPVPGSPFSPPNSRGARRLARFYHPGVAMRDTPYNCANRLRQLVSALWAGWNGPSALTVYYTM